MRSALGLLALWVALAVSLDVSVQAQTSEIAVIVRDGAGRPVSGAEVVAVSGDWRTVATDGGGQVRLQVTPGTWEVMVLHGELAVVPAAQTVTLRAGESKGIEFRALPRSAQVKGSVQFRSDPPTALTALHVAAYSPGPAQTSLPASVAPVAEDRSFSLAVPPGRWRVGLLEIPRGIAARDVAVESGQDSQVDLAVDFRGLVGAMGLIFEAGLITERIGPPFSLTTVGLYAIESDGPHRILATTQARADQTFGIFAPVPAGTPLGAFAWRPGGTAVPAAVRSFAMPGTASFADFRFVVNSGTLVGTVVDTGGRPVADAWVAAVSGVRYEEWMMWGRPVHALGGAFRIPVPLGLVLVRAWRNPDRMGVPQRVSVGGPEPRVVRLEVP